MNLRQFPASPGNSLVYAKHYSALTPLNLSKVLRMSSSDQSGSSSGYTLNSSQNDFLFALDNTRFIHFCRNGSGHPSAVIFEVGAATLTAGSVTALRAASATICEVKQNPKNALQFLLTCTDGYTYLVTAGASGTTITTSSHNTAGTVTSLAYSPQFSGCGAIVWSDAGDCAVTVGFNATTGVGVLFTASGTTLSYVTNTVFSGWTIANPTRYLASLTENASNESLVTMVRNGGVNFCRFTFSTTALTSAASSYITAGTQDLGSGTIGFAAGNIHVYSMGTSPYSTTRMCFNGAGAGSSHISSLTNGMGLQNYYGICPMGDAASWGICPSTTTSNGIVAFLNGLGAGFVGNSALVTAATTDPQAFCVSHNYSKALAITRSSVSPTSYTAYGFNVPTS